MDSTASNQDLEEHDKRNHPKESTDSKRRVLIFILIVIAVFGFPIVTILDALNLTPKLPYFFSLTSLIVTTAGAILIVLVVNSSHRKLEEQRTISEIEVNELQSKIEDDFFTNLVKINFKYIDKYYLQTQLQADKSFMLSVVASIMSFFIIITGIVLMFKGQVNSSLVATGAGILSEFIAAVLFYLYNKTIVKMGEYHHKLVLTQNISLALKITEQMEGEIKSKAQLQLIEQLTKDINLHIASKPTE